MSPRKKAKGCGYVDVLSVSDNGIIFTAQIKLYSIVIKYVQGFLILLFSWEEKLFEFR
jgi:hypothetical protein